MCSVCPEPGIGANKATEESGPLESDVVISTPHSNAGIIEDDMVEQNRYSSTLDTEENKACLENESQSEMENGESSSLAENKTDLGMQNAAQVGISSPKDDDRSDVPSASAVQNGKKSIDILVTGKSGTSKSILVNGILGQKVIPERQGVICKARSSNLEYYPCVIHGYHVNVWSSSHLQDDGDVNEAEYLSELEKKCSNVDLIFYCIKMTDTRFTPGNADARAITKITQRFGHECWKRAIFVMTFANVAASSIFDPLDSDTQESKKIEFTKGIQMWEKILRNTLVNEAGVPRKSINKINVVPAGHYKKPSLPDRDHWLTDLFATCAEVMPKDSRNIILKINASRFTEADKFTPKDTHKLEIHEQPIVLTKKIQKFLDEFIDLKFDQVSGVIYSVGDKLAALKKKIFATK